MNRTIFPASVIIEPTDRCNLSCEMCPRRFLEGEGGYMEFDLFKKVIDEIETYWGTEVILFHRGESLLHPRIVDMVYYAHAKGCRVVLATNATLLTEPVLDIVPLGLDFISFSIDTPGRFVEHRGGADYEKVRRKIARFLRRGRKNPRLITQVSMVATGDTLVADVRELQRLWEGKVCRVRVYEEHSQAGDFGGLRERRGQRKACVKPMEQMVVSWDGSIRRCNHDWDGEPLGVLKSTVGLNDGATLEGIWNGAAYENLRGQHQTLEFTDETCSSCGSWYAGGGEAGTGFLFERGK